MLATSPRECRSRHLWRCGSTTEVTLPKFESTNGVDCFGADVVLHQQNMSRVMIGANLCADLSSLYSLHAPRAAAPKQKRERLSSFPFCTPSGARTAKPWRGYLLKKRRRSRAINFYHIRATLPKFEFAEGTTCFMWFWQTTIGSVVKVVEVANLHAEPLLPLLHRA